MFTRIRKLPAVTDGVAAAHGVSVCRVAIRWNKKAFADTAILGVSKTKHVQQNCGAPEWDMWESSACVWTKHSDIRKDKILLLSG